MKKQKLMAKFCSMKASGNSLSLMQKVDFWLEDYIDSEWKKGLNKSVIESTGKKRAVSFKNEENQKMKLLAHLSSKAQDLVL